MSEPEPQQAKKTGLRRPAIFYWGVFILVVGLVTAALVYALAADDADVEAMREIASGRAYQHNVELMGGKFALLSTEFDRWFASLWHGRTLGYTLAVLSIAIAAGCFWIARLMSPRSSEAERRREE